MAFVLGVMRRATSSGSNVNVSSFTSADTGVAPAWTTEVAEEMNVIDGTITSWPAPTPSAKYTAVRATVPLANATPCSTPCRAANSCSKRSVAAPLVELTRGQDRAHGLDLLLAHDGCGERILGATSRSTLDTT